MTTRNLNRFWQRRLLENTEWGIAAVKSNTGVITSGICYHTTDPEIDPKSGLMHTLEEILTVTPSHNPRDSFIGFIVQD